MAQGLRGRRLTTFLIACPCILCVLTLILAWILPSSTVRDILGRFNGVYGSQTTNETQKSSTSVESSKSSVKDKALGETMVAQELLDLGVYDEASDFVNEFGIRPTGWERPNSNPNVWGPCRFTENPPKQWNDRRRWPPSGNNITTRSPEYYRNADIEDFDYLMKKPTYEFGTVDRKDCRHPPCDINTNNGWCRPGFLIIGAGKCGTSSLYHYLNGHPRILPAIEKQIHYFKYHDSRRPLEWYYGNFPTPLSFLEHGGLVTGEASPGYLPYPAVARNAYKAWKGDLDVDGAGIASNYQPLSKFLANQSYRSMVPEVPPRIIVLGREPLDRIYSSYKYNYVVPTIEHLKTKGHPRISKKEFKLHQDDDYYLPYLFTLEDFVRAELKQLRGCLHEWGAKKTYTKWHRTDTYQEALTLRNGDANTSNNMTNSTILSQPLIDLDGICYGRTVSSQVYREQWKEMQPKNPTKVLLNKNLHLSQAFIGRSLYVFPLDWWYVNFRPDPDDPSTAESITFVCTEDLNKVDTLNDLTARLGLPKFDGFDEILNEGAYNVGGHRGYDKATSWEELEKEKEMDEDGTNDTNENSDATEGSSTEQSSTPMTNGIPLPEDLYLELKEFINPINERLFALTGKRCDW